MYTGTQYESDVCSRRVGGRGGAHHKNQLNVLPVSVKTDILHNLLEPLAEEAAPLAFQSMLVKRYTEMHRASAHSVGRALVWRLKGCWLEYIHWRSHCAVSLSETLYPPLSIDSTHEDQS